MKTTDRFFVRELALRVNSAFYMRDRQQAMAGLRTRGFEHVLTSADKLVWTNQLEVQDIVRGVRRRLGEAP